MKIVKISVESSNLYNSFDIEKIKINQVVVFDIFIKKDKNYLIIIEAGTTMDDKLYKKLQNQDDLYIKKEDKAKEVLNPKTLKFYIQANKDDIPKRLELLYSVNKQIFDLYNNDSKNKINVSNIELVVSSIIFLIEHNNDFIKTAMPYFTNKYTISNHSLHVAIYAIKLGILLNFRESRLALLGTSALLHDIGYKKIDQNILHKEDKHDEKDTKEVNQHTRYSVEIAKQNNVNDTNILDGIMHHHERYDGSGYPHKLRENDMSEFASILSICDVFDALTNHRPHREEFSSFDALKLMIKDPNMINQFNQKYLSLALQSLQ